MESIYNYQKLTDRHVKPTSNPNNKWIVMGAVALIALFLVFLGYIALSPFITVWGMRNAAIAKDGKRFASYIDFPVFKENLKAELNAAMMDKMSNDSSMRNNPFAGIGMMLAPALVNNMVDAMVTPQGIERMMDGQIVPAPTNATQTKETRESNPFLSGDANFSYESFGEFRVNVLNPDGKIVSLVFERHWIGDWKLAGIRLPR